MEKPRYGPAILGGPETAPMHNQPANTFYFQSPESDYIFLWAEKKLTEGDSLRIKRTDLP
ncbi:MAG: hypothetical protein J7L72_05205 [Candidatus Aminicenantes bacterium]|nr:hypothetical protein [Candidatus Aminicenantes bacterium]